MLVLQFVDLPEYWFIIHLLPRLQVLFCSLSDFPPSTLILDSHPVVIRVTTSAMKGLRTFRMLVNHL